MANNQLLAFDNFASGSLAAGWTNIFGGSKCQVAGGSPFFTEPGAIGATLYGQLWNGITWSNDQISEVTVQALTSSTNNFLQLRVRYSTSADSGYRAVITNGTAALYVVTAGTPTQLGSTVSGLTFAAGDVWTFAAIGSVLFLYQNGARVAYVTDSTYLSGIPGYCQEAITVLTQNEVASWRGYNSQQQNGIWTTQGCILPGTTAEMGSSSGGNAGLSVNFGPSKFLNAGGNCYRGYWVYNTATPPPNVAYGESLDGKNWNRYASNPVISGFGGGVVSFLGGTLYMWGQSTPGSIEPNFFTSTDGVTWTNHGACTGLSVSNFSMYSPCLIDIINGTYYVLVSGLNSLNSDRSSTWLATSTDGKTFTIQNGTNSVFDGAFAGANIFKIGSTYYLPATANQPGQLSSGATKFDPQYGILYQCSDPTFITWTINSTLAQNQLINDSLNNPDGGVAPYCMIDVNGTAFHYYQGSPSDSIAPEDFQCMLASAPSGVTLAQIVKFSQTATQQIATDNFSGGTGNLPTVNPSWTTPSWSTTLQVVAGPYVEATLATGARCTAVYTGSSFGRYQYSEATIHTLAGAGGSSLLFLLLCATTSGSKQAYYASVPSPTGTQSTSGGFQISKTVNGVQTVLSSVATTPANNQITPQVGDVFRFAVWPGSDGSNILRVYQNGAQVLEAQDYAASLTSGNPGIQLNTTVLTNAQLSSWAGGNANVIPNYFSSIADDRFIQQLTTQLNHLDQI